MKRRTPPLRRALLMLLAVLLPLGGLTVAVSPGAVAEDLGADCVTSSSDPNLTGDYNEDLLYLTNCLRAANGVAPLKISWKLAGLASRWAKRGPYQSGIGHDPNPGEGYPTGYTKGGENVFSGADNVVSPLSAFTWWEHSELHRRNMLDPDFNYLGTGTNAPDPGGYRHVVQRFAQIPDDINPDDSSTWRPEETTLGAVKTRQKTIVEQDETLAAGDMTDLDTEALNAVNALRAANGVAPVRLGAKITRSARDWADHMSDYYVNSSAADPNLASAALTGSGTKAQELIMKAIGWRDGSYLSFYWSSNFIKGTNTKSILLNPEWEVMGVGENLTYDDSFSFSTLRFGAYPADPPPGNDDGGNGDNGGGTDPGDGGATDPGSGGSTDPGDSSGDPETPSTGGNTGGDGDVSPAPSTGGTGSTDGNAPKTKTAKTKTTVKGVTKRVKVKAHGKFKVKQSFIVSGGKRAVKVQQKVGSTWKPVKGVKVKVKANGKVKVVFKAKAKAKVKTVFRIKVAANKQFKAATARFKVITRK